MKRAALTVFCSIIALIGSSQDNVFDSHVHLWNGAASLEQYLHELDSTGQSVTKFGAIFIARHGEQQQTKAKNDELIALAKKNPKLTPICSVHPYDSESTAELKRIAALGVRVIKLHPHTQNFDVTDKRVLKLCEQAGQLGVNVLMDNAAIKPGDCENLFDLAVRCPLTKFIFAHMGALNFRFWNIVPVARTAKGFYKDNIYFDISATITLMSGSPIEDEFIWTIRNVGVDHVFLGSDFPQYTLKQAVEALDKLNLKKEEKDAIRYENATKLFTYSTTHQE